MWYLKQFWSDTFPDAISDSCGLSIKALNAVTENKTKIKLTVSHSHQGLQLKHKCRAAAAEALGRWTHAKGGSEERFSPPQLWVSGMSPRDVRPRGLASVSRPILLASVSSCLASVLALASIIWPQPRVERGQDPRCEVASEQYYIKHILDIKHDDDRMTVNKHEQTRKMHRASVAQCEVSA